MVEDAVRQAFKLSDTFLEAFVECVLHFPGFKPFTPGYTHKLQEGAIVSQTGIRIGTLIYFCIEGDVEEDDYRAERTNYQGNTSYCHGIHIRGSDLMKHLVLLISAVIVLALASCQAKSMTEVSPGTNSGSVEQIDLQDGSTLYFPRQPSGDGDQMEALLEGQLILENDCLRVVSSGFEDPGFLILWPSGATPYLAEDGSLDVNNGSNQVIGRLGEPIRVGGGAMESESSMALWEQQIEGLPITGCTGPYWVVGALYPLEGTDATSPNQPLATPYAQQPAAGICAEYEGPVVSISLRPDMPDPRCVLVKPEQYLIVKNETDQKLQISFAHIQVELDPGEEFTDEMPFEQYLAPGVHQLTTSMPPGGPEIWLQDSLINDQ